MIALSLAMIVLGVLGLTDVMTLGQILAAVLLGIALILSYDAVRTTNSNNVKHPSPSPTNPIHPTLFSMDQ